MKLFYNLIFLLVALHGPLRHLHAMSDPIEILFRYAESEQHPTTHTDTQLAGTPEHLNLEVAAPTALERLNQATLDVLNQEPKNCTEPANIRHLLSQEKQNGLLLDINIIDQGINGTCSWQQLHKLTHMLCKATVPTALKINIKTAPTYIPTNPLLRTLWNDQKFEADEYWFLNYKGHPWEKENERWLAALWETTNCVEKLDTRNTELLPQEISTHLQTLVAFFEVFVPMPKTPTPLNELNTQDPQVATKYAALCFKHLHNLVQFTESFTLVTKEKRNEKLAKAQRALEAISIAPNATTGIYPRIQTQTPYHSCKKLDEPAAAPKPIPAPAAPKQNHPAKEPAKKNSCIIE